MNGQNQNLISNKLDALAEHFKESVNIDDKFCQNYILELFLNLNHQKIEPGNDEFFHYHSFLKQVVCIFSDPEVSSKLDVYYQKKASQMFRELLFFFEAIYDSSHILDWLFYRWITEFSGIVDAKKFKEIEDGVHQLIHERTPAA